MLESIGFEFQKIIEFKKLIYSGPLAMEEKISMSPCLQVLFSMITKC